MKIVEVWRRLPPRSKIVASFSVVAIVVMLGLVGRAASTPQMALLYAGLDASASGEILESLEAMDIRADVRGDAIYVPEPQRDATRMALAREGLPSQSQAGFEILDGLNAFATSSDLFDATYWRAKEGELARTILAESGIRTARVHLAIPRRSAFSRVTAAPSAVVTAGLAKGRLDAERAQAMRVLVALAVPGLSPDQVAVLDAAGGVVLAPGAGQPDTLGGGKLADREEALERDLVDILEARVGPGNARVKVTLAISDQQQVRHERLVDPDRRALTSTESTQLSEQGLDGVGVVTVASNLPDGDGAATTAPPQSRRSETSEATRFDVSEVKTETVIMPGALRQVQVAVLVNDLARDGGDAAKRPETELEALRKLVAAAVGYDESRGDVVTIESMGFDEPDLAGTEATKNPMVDLLSANLLPALQIIVPAIVSLVLALFVVRPLLASAAETGVAPMTPAADGARLSPTPPAAQIQSAATPLTDLQRLANEQRGATSAVLKTWLEQSEPA